jgi:hypothetical protein
MHGGGLKGREQLISCGFHPRLQLRYRQLFATGHVSQFD